MKAGSGLVREERESALDREQFDTFWPATEGRRIEKTRWTGRLPGGRLFELVIFEGAHAPLRLVEVEFGSREIAEAFMPPHWFGPKVTEDGTYTNKVMAFRGTPTVFPAV